MRRYRRLNYQDRVEIHRLLKLNWSQKEIAVRLGVCPSTICREIKRNSGLRGYRYAQAHRLSEQRFYSRRWFKKMTKEVKAVIVSYLEDGWTPEQASGRFKLENYETVSHETIYKFIYQDALKGGRLFKLLPRHHRVRRRRGRKIHDKRGSMANMLSIKNRPKSASKRSRVGHLERDSMLCQNRRRNIQVAVELKTRFMYASKCEDHRAETIHKATVKMLKGQKVRSITNDQGREYAAHQKTAKSLQTKIYFCDAGKPYQRGLNEGKIAILRRYLPKGTCLKNLTTAQLKKITDKINKTPMKCLGWLTPYEVMFKTRIALVN